MSRINSEVSIAHSFVYTLSGEFKSTEEQKATPAKPEIKTKPLPPRDNSYLRDKKSTGELPARFWPTTDPRRKGQERQRWSQQKSKNETPVDPPKNARNFKLPETSTPKSSVKKVGPPSEVPKASVNLVGEP